MLTIRRVPTLVSNYQEDASEQQKQEGIACGRNCLGVCCFPVSKLPLYVYEREEDKSIDNGSLISSDEEPSLSSLSIVLLGQWEDRMRRGLFRYDVTACETKVIPGNYGFIAQLNEGRHLKKRPTEFRVDQVLQQFDDNKFNFTKVGLEEMLFRFESSEENKNLFFPSLSVDLDSVSPNIAAINVSPIEYGHVLLIPRLLDRLPQRIDHESFLLALRFAKEAAHTFFRLGYNSLGAFATINHLHFQAYYLSAPFAVERASTCKAIRKELNGCRVTVSELSNYPVRGLVFEGGSTLQDLSVAVANACIWLQNCNIPFNILIVDCGKKVFLFPQCYAEKQALGQVSQELLDTHVNPAVWEISGHIVLKRREDYEDASEDSMSRLLAEVSLSENRFDEMKGFIYQAAGFVETGLEANVTNMEEGLHKPHADQVLSECPQNCMVVQ